MSRHPRLALPFTFLTDPGVVRLVAGEDFRFTLRAPGLDEWLPALLARCDGRLSLDDLIANLNETRKESAVRLIERLYSERVLIDGTASDAHRPMRCRLAVEGTGPLTEVPEPGEGETTLSVLCQDCLDYEAALRFNRRMREGQSPWLWISTGAMSRGYVSPVFLPDAGPCLECLLRQFRMLSPAREIHDALIEHGRRGLPFTPAEFPAEGVAILARIAEWKARLLAEEQPPATLYRLHVLEADSLEVSSHRVFRDPECPGCGRG